MAGDGHAVFVVGEDGGFDVVALVQVVRTARPAGHQARALLDARADQVLDLVPLRLRHDRAELAFARVADADALDQAFGDLGRLIHARARDEHPRGRIAGLT